jgi:hypothetical protein
MDEGNKISNSATDRRKAASVGASVGLPPTVTEKCLLLALRSDCLDFSGRKDHSLTTLSPIHIQRPIQIQSRVVA